MNQHWDAKEKAIKIKDCFDFPISIEKEESEFKIISYTLLVKEHYDDLHNLHTKKINQSYKSVHNDYLEFRLKNRNYSDKTFNPLYFITISPNGEPLKEDNETTFYVGSTNSCEYRC